MRAALMERGRIWVEECADPEPTAGEVLVRTLACGICGSDLHAAQHTESFVTTSREAGGAFKLTTYEPVVLGHEFCAEIVDYGPDTAREHAVGTQVCAVPMLMRQPPQAVGYSDEVPGGFAELMVLSERLLEPVPAGTPPTSAALTEPMAVGLHAVNKARLNGDEAIVVLGCGPVGLAVITALKARGAGPIVASDYSPGRRRFAAQQGADVVCNAAEENPFQSAELKGRDMVIFECVGVPGMLDNAFRNASQNARIVVVGVCLQQDHAHPLVAINKELLVQYVLGYSFDEFRESLRYIADGSFAIEPLITDRIGLDEVSDMFTALKDPEQQAKVLVEPWR